MKNNTEPTKDFLQRALQSLPNDFALNEVRSHLKMALSKLEMVENRRAKRESQQQANNNWVMVNNELMHPDMAKKVIAELDRMIKYGKLTLEQMKKKKELSDEDQNIQTLHD